MKTITEVEKSTNVENRIIPWPASSEPSSSVYVVHTSMDCTLKALEKAREVALPLGAKIFVVALEVVPFPMQLDRPPIPTEFIAQRFKEKADEFPEGTHVVTYVCRNPMDAFQQILKKNSPVVIGVKKRWVPSRDEHMAQKLSRAGYDVRLVKTE